MKAEQRIYRSADGDIVAEDDPRAAFLVVAAGKEVPKDYEEKVRAFLGADTRTATAADTEDTSKQAPKPANKAVTKQANK